MSSFVISNKYPCFADKLSKMGHNVIFSDTVKAFPQPEQAHADMQILTINNTVFVLQECEKLKTLPYKENLIICKSKAGKKYPENVLLNFLFFNSFCNILPSLPTHFTFSHALRFTLYSRKSY